MKKIEERTFEFALEVVSVYKFLIVRKEYVLSKQMLRSGTLIGANVQEAQAAQRAGLYFQDVHRHQGSQSPPIGSAC